MVKFPVHRYDKEPVRILSWGNVNWWRWFNKELFAFGRKVLIIGLGVDLNILVGAQDDMGGNQLEGSHFINQFDFLHQLIIHYNVDVPGVAFCQYRISIPT